MIINLQRIVNYLSPIDSGFTEYLPANYLAIIHYIECLNTAAVRGVHCQLSVVVPHEISAVMSIINRSVQNSLIHQVDRAENKHFAKHLFSVSDVFLQVVVNFTLLKTDIFINCGLFFIPFYHPR